MTMYAYRTTSRCHHTLVFKILNRKDRRLTRPAIRFDSYMSDRHDTSLYPISKGAVALAMPVLSASFIQFPVSRVESRSPLRGRIEYSCHYVKVLHLTRRNVDLYDGAGIVIHKVAVDVRRLHYVTI